jgi:hypothetical protein
MMETSTKKAAVLLSWQATNMRTESMHIVTSESVTATNAAARRKRTVPATPLGVERLVVGDHLYQHHCSYHGPHESEQHLDA